MNSGNRPWTDKHCVPAKTLKAPMAADAIATALGDIHEAWQLSSDGTWISRRYRFRNYYETVSFVNAVAWIAHTEDHHPDIEFGYRTCTIRYTTHAVDGITENDVTCAAKIDALITRDEG